MISADPRNKLLLAIRTRFRQGLIWMPLLPGETIAPDEELLNKLHLDTGQAFVTVADEILQVKEYQRDQTSAQAQAEVDQERFLADDKAAAERRKIAIKIASDNYLYAARIYDAEVKGLVMAAREYAAQIEREQVQIEAARVSLAVDKEVVHRQEVEIKVQIEEVNTAMVKADLAKSKLEVARTQVQALMADIEAQKAGIQVVEAQVQIAMSQAEMATLQADVAMIFAEAVTKQLSAIRLRVEEQDISQTFGFVAQKLSDMLAIWGARVSAEQTKLADQATILTAIQAVAAAELSGAHLPIDEANMAVAVANAEAGAASSSLAAQAPLLMKDADGHLGLSQAETDMRVAMSNAHMASTILVNAAKVAVYGKRVRDILSTTRELFQVFKG